jgi:hypothetical protein
VIVFLVRSARSQRVISLARVGGAGDASRRDGVTGPEDYQRAEQLPEHAATMLDADVAPEDRAEFVQRQAAVVGMATAHAVLATAGVLGMSARLGSADEIAWRDVAGTP